MNDSSEKMDALKNSTLYRGDGEIYQGELIEAFATCDQSIFYPVINQIALLLPQSVLLAERGLYKIPQMVEKQISVQEFYEKIGWLKTDEGAFIDTVTFTETTNLAVEYRKRCNGKIGKLLKGGESLLDVASGPIPHTEYIDLSKNYKIRICIDFSFRALSEARSKLGERGFYVLGDITNLPLMDNTVSDTISLHTIYHLPTDLQPKAVAEIVRVTAPEGKAIIVYEWKFSRAMEVAFTFLKCLVKIKSSIAPSKKEIKKQSHLENRAPPSLFFNPQDYAWYKNEIASKFSSELRCWSLVNQSLQKILSKYARFSWCVLRCIELFENIFPGFAGKHGQYPMFIIRKQND